MRRPILNIVKQNPSQKTIIPNQYDNTMNKEDQNKLRKGQWASLETVMENLRLSGMDQQKILKIATEQVAWRIKRMISQLPDEDAMKLFAQLTNNQSSINQ